MKPLPILISLAICLGLLAVFAIGRGTFLTGFGVANYQRAQIVQRQPDASGAQKITVQLGRSEPLTVALKKTDTLHPDARYMCVNVIGDPADGTARLQFAKLENCPLPVARTLPASGIVKTQTRTGNVTTRTFSSGPAISGNGNSFSSGGLSISR